MTQEEKALLLKDLCDRIPYGVKCQVYDFTSPYTLSGIIPSKVYQELYFEEMDYKECNGLIDIKYSKPYLFPLSSMTEEQRKELQELHFDYISDAIFIDTEFVCHSDYVHIIDWLNKNHFDWRGLIPNGLAIDATKLNIYN